MSTTTPHPSPPPAEHEIKLVTPALRAAAMAIWLRARCLPDPKYPHGLVTSIYYDNNRLDLLDAKVNSDFLKHKVRVRWYSDPDSGTALDPAFAEIKRKVGGRRFKERLQLQVPVSTLDAHHTDHTALRQLLEPLRQAGHWTATDLQPFLRIAFRRRRFIDPTSGSRISIDSDIRGRSLNPGLLPQSHPAPLAHAVIEIKGSRSSLPRWLSPLRDMGCRPESFSKYARCYQQLTRQSSF